jgi:hypothetical protein
MPHVLPPEDEDSPASTFAPFQPSAGVVSDDVVDKGQEGKDSIPASEATEKFKSASKKLQKTADDEARLPDSQKMDATGEAFDPKSPALPQDEGREVQQPAPKKSTAK